MLEVALVACFHQRRQLVRYGVLRLLVSVRGLEQTQALGVPTERRRVKGILPILVEEVRIRTPLRQHLARLQSAALRRLEDGLRQTRKPTHRYAAAARPGACAVRRVLEACATRRVLKTCAARRVPRGVW